MIYNVRETVRSIVTGGGDAPELSIRVAAKLRDESELMVQIHTCFAWEKGRGGRPD